MFPNVSNDEPLMKTEPVNSCLSSAGVSPKIVEPLENEVVTSVTVDFTI